ncbi:MAG: flagellar motor protein MotB [Hylemonella sp.]
MTQPEVPDPAALQPAAGHGAAPAVTVRTRAHRGSFERWHISPPPTREAEGWFLTYLDVMTLLLVTMVVVLAFVEPRDRHPPAVAAVPQPLASAPQAAASEPQAAASEPAADPLAGLPLEQLGNSIEVLVSGRTVSFRISSEILFASGEAGLTPAGQELVSRLLPALRAAERHAIVVEGHTDDVPIQTARFPSNWELAAGRAGSVVRFLVSQGIAPQRMRAIGYADTRPIAPNDTPAGRAANRRVEIVLEAQAEPPR